MITKESTVTAQMVTIAINTRRTKKAITEFSPIF